MISIVIGSTFTNRSGATYSVVALDGRGGFTAARANGKTFKVSAGMMRKASRLLASGPVPFRSISYTVAIEAGVCFALGLIADTTTKTYSR